MLGERSGRDADGRQGDGMRGPGRSHGGGSWGSLAQEQIESRLARSGAAVIGEMMRSMASDPGLRQLLFGGLGDEAMG